MSIQLPPKTLEESGRCAYAVARDLDHRSRPTWQELSEDDRDYWRAIGRGALFGAIPHMQQAGWLVRMP